MIHMSKCDFISDYENFEVVNIEDFRELTSDEINTGFQEFLDELENFVIFSVVADGERLRSAEELNGYSRWKLANIFLEATNSEFGFLAVDVDNIAVDIDNLIPLAYCGFNTRELNYLMNITDTDLVYRYYENYDKEECGDRKHFKGFNSKEVEIPQSIKGYKYTPMVKEVTPMP